MYFLGIGIFLVYDTVQIQTSYIFIGTIILFINVHVSVFSIDLIIFFLTYPSSTGSRLGSGVELVMSL